MFYCQIEQHYYFNYKSGLNDFGRDARFLVCVFLGGRTRVTTCHFFLPPIMKKSNQINQAVKLFKFIIENVDLVHLLKIKVFLYRMVIDRYRDDGPLSIDEFEAFSDLDVMLDHIEHNALRVKK